MQQREWDFTNGNMAHLCLLLSCLTVKILGLGYSRESCAFLNSHHLEDKMGA